MQSDRFETLPAGVALIAASSLLCPQRNGAEGALPLRPSTHRTLLSLVHSLRTELSTETPLGDPHAALHAFFRCAHITSDVQAAVRSSWLSRPVIREETFAPNLYLLPTDDPREYEELTLHMDAYTCSGAFLLNRFDALCNVYEYLEKYFPRAKSGAFGTLPSVILGPNWAEPPTTNTIATDRGTTKHTAPPDNRLVSKKTLEAVRSNVPMRFAEFVSTVTDCTMSLSDDVFHGSQLACRVVNSVHTDVEALRSRARMALYRHNDHREPRGLRERMALAIRSLDAECFSTTSTNHFPRLLQTIVKDDELLLALGFRLENDGPAAGGGLAAQANVPGVVAITEAHRQRFALTLFLILESFPVIAFASRRHVGIAEDYIAARGRSRKQQPSSQRSSTIFEEYGDAFAAAVVNFAPLVFPVELNISRSENTTAAGRSVAPPAPSAPSSAPPQHQLQHSASTLQPPPRVMHVQHSVEGGVDESTSKATHPDGGTHTHIQPSAIQSPKRDGYEREAMTGEGADMKRAATTMSATDASFRHPSVMLASTATPSIFDQRQPVRNNSNTNTTTNTQPPSSLPYDGSGAELSWWPSLKSSAPAANTTALEHQHPGPNRSVDVAAALHVPHARRVSPSRHHHTVAAHTSGLDDLRREFESVMRSPTPPRAAATSAPQQQHQHAYLPQQGQQGATRVVPAYDHHASPYKAPRVPSSYTSAATRDMRSTSPARDNNPNLDVRNDHRHVGAERDVPRTHDTAAIVHPTSSKDATTYQGAPRGHYVKLHEHSPSSSSRTTVTTSNNTKAVAHHGRGGGTDHPAAATRLDAAFNRLSSAAAAPITHPWRSPSSHTQSMMPAAAMVRRSPSPIDDVASRMVRLDPMSVMEYSSVSHKGSANGVGGGSVGIPPSHTASHAFPHLVTGSLKPIAGATSSTTHHSLCHATAAAESTQRNIQGSQPFRVELPPTTAFTSSGNAATSTLQRGTLRGVEHQPTYPSSSNATNHISVAPHGDVQNHPQQWSSGRAVESQDRRTTTTATTQASSFHVQLPTFGAVQHQPTTHHELTRAPLQERSNHLAASGAHNKQHPLCNRSMELRELEELIAAERQRRR